MGRRRLYLCERRKTMSLYQNGPKTSIFHLLKYTIGSFKHSKIFIFVIFFSLPIVMAAYDYQSNKSINHETIDLQNIAFMVSNLLISIVIILFFFISSLYIKQINSLKNAFKYDNPDPSYSYEGIFNRTLKWLKLGSNEGKILVFKIVYYIAWICISYKLIEYVINIYKQHIGPNGFKYAASMNLAVLLYGIAFALLGFSVLGTLVWLRFFYRLSCSDNHKYLVNYEYNITTPVNTYGFRKWISFIKLNVICFTITSVLVILAFCIHIFSANSKEELCKLQNNKFLLVFLLYFLLGVVGSILTFALPTLCMKRIITVWTDNSASEFSSKINFYKQFGIYGRKIDEYEQKLQTLYSNRSIFKYDIVSFFLTIITLLATIAPVFVSLK